ncbi:MAG: hypothetical protein P8188_16915 [Gemmatimonadota bacterium]
MTCLPDAPPSSPFSRVPQSVPGRQWRAVAAALLGLTLQAAGSPTGVLAQDVPRFTLELEAGPIWQSRNDVRIPNDASGTRFSLVDVAGNGPWPSARLYATWNINRRHGLRLLAAPLSYTEAGSVAEPVAFAGATFRPDEPLSATYRFNSWRLGYRYRIMDRERLRLWIGFTAKLRDAKIALEQGAVYSEDTDLGFVPLLAFAGDWEFARRWHGLLDFEGLAGGPGRAFDVSLQLRRTVADRWDVGAGYRTIEGGADVDEVYNFAWLHALVISVTFRF